MKRRLSLILALLMAASAVSCGSTGSGGETTSGSGGETGTASETEAETTDIVTGLTPELREQLGLDGYEFNVMLTQQGTDWSIHDLVAEEETGDILNDAVYSRNLYLEDKCGFRIKAGYSADFYGSEMTTFIMAGDTTYDAYFPMARSAGGAASQGLLYDLNELRYLDLDNDCWNKLFSDTLSIGGKLYYAAGDISTNSFSAISVMFFNKTIHENLKLDNPYDLVRNGKWTVDALNSMAVAGSADLNGNAKMDDEDQWGMMLPASVGGLFFYYGFNEKITSKDSDDMPVIEVGSETSIRAYDRIVQLLSDKNTYNQMQDQAKMMKDFADGKALFYYEVLDVANRVRPYEIDFGILPAPKYDEAQENYLCNANGWCVSPIVVPKIVENPDRTGFIIEAIAETSKQYIVPVFYDKVLTGKALRDDDSADMLDLIVYSFVLDNADIYQWGNLDTQMRDGMTKGTDLSSIIAKNRSAFEKAIEKTVAGTAG